MVRVAIAWALLLLVVPAAALAQVEKRIALLIGNQSYTPEIGVLANPHNDVALLERTLKGLGFEVATLRDADLAALTRAVNAYARRLAGGGQDAIGFFYYSGHGASDAGTNYLIPIDVKTTEAGELWDQSLRLTEITRKLRSEAGNATHFVVFDACRNSLKLRKPGTRALVQSKGFVPVVQENGMLIAYATAEGELASDVGDGAGPYAKVLADEIVKPGVEAVAMFRRVQVRVRSAISQEPWLGFSALGEVHFAGAQTDAAKPVATAPSSTSSDAERAWSVAKDTSSVAVLEAFIARYRYTFYADLARARIEDLKKQHIAIATPPKAVGPARPAAPVASAVPTACDGVEGLIGSEHRCVKPNETFKDCQECPEMMVVPSGEFIMGALEGGKANELPQHKVTISKAFAVSKFEVTFAEWDACIAAAACKHRPDDRGWGRGRRPAINVSWDDIMQEFLPWLSRVTGGSYRLLTEAEWEYAARAGTTTPFSTGSTITSTQANFDGRYTYPNTGAVGKGPNRQKTIEVGSFPANGFGLHDMHGNVWEWVHDCYSDNYAVAPANGSAVQDVPGCARVLRGGCWDSDPAQLRSGYRFRLLPSTRYNFVGFRVAKTR
jgi:formylglycine-generating enzyme required for sulfatase activity